MALTQQRRHLIKFEQNAMRRNKSRSSLMMITRSWTSLWENIIRKSPRKRKQLSRKKEADHAKNLKIKIQTVRDKRIQLANKKTKLMQSWEILWLTLDYWWWKVTKQTQQIFQNSGWTKLCKNQFSKKEMILLQFSSQVTKTHLQKNWTQKFWIMIRLRQMIPNKIWLHWMIQASSWR